MEDQVRYRLLQRLILPLLLLLAPAVRCMEPAWPVVSLPADAAYFEIGKQLTMNGVPMRMQGFASGSRPQELLSWFRRQLGQPLVENSQERKWIIGRGRGEFFITVQLEPAATGTRGLVAVSHLKAALLNRRADMNEGTRILSNFPAGSRMLSRMSSIDDGRQAAYLVITNDYSVELNIERIKQMMHADQLLLERDTGSGMKAELAAAVSGHVLTFKGSHKEVQALVFRAASGQTEVVLNTVSMVSLLEAGK